MGTTYWRTVVLYRDLFPGRPCPSSQFLHRFAKRVGIQELKDLQAQFKKRLSPFLPKGEIRPVDPGLHRLPCRSKGQKLRWRRGREVQVVRGHSRLCCLMRHFPERWFRTVGRRGLEIPAGLRFPSGDLASYSPEAGPLGGGGLQPPGVPHLLFAFTLDPQSSLPSALRLVRQNPSTLDRFWVQHPR